MDLMRDVLDKRILDRDGEITGRVDGMIMEWHAGEAPRVTELTLGGTARWRRVSRHIATLAHAIGSRLGPRRTTAVHVPWNAIQHFGRNVKLNIAASETHALVWERWIDRHVIKRIPGGSSK